jgi:hypothetical protein
MHLSIFVVKSPKPVVFDKLSSETIQKFLKLKFLNIDLSLLMKLFENFWKHSENFWNYFSYSKSSKIEKLMKLAMRSLLKLRVTCDCDATVPNAKMTVYRTHLLHLFVTLLLLLLLLLHFLFSLNFTCNKQWICAVSLFLMNVLANTSRG